MKKKAIKKAVGQYINSAANVLQTNGDIVINNYFASTFALCVPDISREIGVTKETLKLLNMTSSEIENGMFDTRTLLMAFTHARCSIEKHLHILEGMRNERGVEAKIESNDIARRRRGNVLLTKGGSLC